jgi:hypothetical protein
MNERSVPSKLGDWIAEYVQTHQDEPGDILIQYELAHPGDLEARFGEFELSDPEKVLTGFVKYEQAHINDIPFDLTLEPTTEKVKAIADLLAQHESKRTNESFLRIMWAGGRAHNAAMIELCLSYGYSRTVNAILGMSTSKNNVDRDLLSNILFFKCAQLETYCAARGEQAPKPIRIEQILCLKALEEIKENAEVVGNDDLYDFLMRFGYNGPQPQYARFVQYLDVCNQKDNEEFAAKKKREDT